RASTNILTPTTSSKDAGTNLPSNDYDATFRVNAAGQWEENNFNQYYNSSSSMKFNMGDFNFNQDVDEDTMLCKAFDEAERIKQRLLAKANSSDPSPSFPPPSVIQKEESSAV